MLRASWRRLTLKKVEGGLSSFFNHIYLPPHFFFALGVYKQPFVSIASRVNRVSGQLVRVGFAADDPYAAYIWLLEPFLPAG
jgi:hypothetical protein